MRRGLLAIAVFAAAANAEDAGRARVMRVSLASVERGFDSQVQKLRLTEQVDILGLTRGVYLAGYGAVFTAEVSFTPAVVLTPFRPKYTKEEIAGIRQKKLALVPRLKENMRQMLLAAAASLEEVPAAEQIVLGLTLYAASWEDTAGLPSQILMQTDRQSLLDFQKKRIDAATLEARLRVQEF